MSVNDRHTRWVGLSLSRSTPRKFQIITLSSKNQWVSDRTVSRKNKNSSISCRKNCVVLKWSAVNKLAQVNEIKLFDDCFLLLLCIHCDYLVLNAVFS